MSLLQNAQTTPCVPAVIRKAGEMYFVISSDNEKSRLQDYEISPFGRNDLTPAMLHYARISNLC